MTTLPCHSFRFILIAISEGLWTSLTPSCKSWTLKLKKESEHILRAFSVGGNFGAHCQKQFSSSLDNMRQYSGAANRWLWMSKATSFQKETPENKPQCLLNLLSGISLAQTTTRRKPLIESFASQLLRIFSCFGEAHGFLDMWTKAHYWSPDI